MVAFLYGFEQIYVDMLYAVLLALVFLVGYLGGGMSLRYFRRVLALYQSFEAQGKSGRSLPEASDCVSFVSELLRNAQRNYGLQERGI